MKKQSQVFYLHLDILMCEYLKLIFKMKHFLFLKKPITSCNTYNKKLEERYISNINYRTHRVMKLRMCSHLFESVCMCLCGGGVFVTMCMCIFL